MKLKYKVLIYVCAYYIYEIYLKFEIWDAWVDR